METNEAGKAEKFFNEFGKRLDQFIAEVKDSSARMETNLNEKFEELKAAGEKIKNEAENKERWKEVEEGLKKAGAELENAFKSAFRKKENG